MEHWKKIGQKIKRQRKRLHLTQKELAQKTDTSTTYISDLENGRTVCSFNKLNGFAKQLGCSMQVDLKPKN